MKLPRIMLAALMATGQALVTANGVLATPPGGASVFAPRDHSPPLVRLVQGGERLDRLWQNRTILEQALQAPPAAIPDVPPALPRARPLQVPPPQPELEHVAEASDQVVSCEEAANIVADYGFSAVRPTACSGDVYRFSATRDGTAYAIGIAAAAGEITEVRRE